MCDTHLISCAQLLHRDVASASDFRARPRSYADALHASLRDRAALAHWLAGAAIDLAASALVAGAAMREFERFRRGVQYDHHRLDRLVFVEMIDESALGSADDEMHRERALTATAFEDHVSIFA